jgi:hypothetical protein
MSVAVAVRVVMAPSLMLVAGWFHTTPEKSLSPLKWTLAVSPCLVQHMRREPPRDCIRKFI